MNENDIGVDNSSRDPKQALLSPTKSSCTSSNQLHPYMCFREAQKRSNLYEVSFVYP